jgi:hypothetical protein
MEQALPSRTKTRQLREEPKAVASRIEALDPHRVQP